MKKILILGAGPAGLSCGMELSSNGYSGVILEKNSKIGGLAKTIKFEENYYTFRTDIGPHRFFSKNKYIHSYISNILDDKWIDVKRSTMQYIDGKYFDYPINPLQAFKNIGLIKTIKFCIDYLKSVIIYIIFKKKIETFEEYIFSKFGKSLAKFNITNYTEKVWGMSCKELHPDWAKERIKGLSFFSVIKNMLFGINQTKSLVQYFKYPENGTGEIYETIGEKICTTDFKIFENTYPIKIIHNNNKIKKIEFKIKNLVKNIEPEHIISSIPITEFISLMNPKPPIKILNASKNLKWRSQVYLFITLNKKRVTKNQWIYFPNINIPFGRISEMKNFSKKMSPKNKTSILIEYFT
ncbi:NAD(P)-binding protein, partial [archaeon]|nr:NAD(P)-binding protein [archaeon]